MLTGNLKRTYVNVQISKTLTQKATSLVPKEDMEQVVEHFWEEGQGWKWDKVCFEKMVKKWYF